MHRIRKERRPTNKKSKVYFPSFSHDVFVLYSLREVFSILPYMYFISVLPCCSVFFTICGMKYSMKAKLFMEYMWELCNEDTCWWVRKSIISNRKMKPV
jgi:hypothetical protein